MDVPYSAWPALRPSLPLGSAVILVNPDDDQSPEPITEGLLTNERSRIGASTKSVRKG